jgi:O-succinylbenzoic acid--CoA ligase
MESPLDYLKSSAENDLFIGYDRHKFRQVATQLYLELSQLLEQGTAPTIFLAHSDPIDFLAGFIAACAAGCPVFYVILTG